MNTNNNTTTNNSNDLLANLASDFAEILRNNNAELVAEAYETMNSLRVEAMHKLAEARQIDVKGLFESAENAERALKSKVHGHIGSALGQDKLRSIFDGIKNAETREQYSKILHDLEQKVIENLGWQESWDEVQAKFLTAEAAKQHRDELANEAREYFAEANDIAKLNGWEVTVEKNGKNHK